MFALFLCHFHPTLGKLLALLGQTLQMGTFGLKNRNQYWTTREGGAKFGINEVMCLRQWEVIWQHLLCRNAPSGSADANTTPLGP